MKVRWTIFLFLCGFAMLSYVQRTSLGVAAQNIMPELHLSQMQIGWLNAAFATCYALAQLPGGVLGQRFGARLTYTVVGLVGLVATIATPLAPACWPAPPCSSRCSRRRACSAFRRARCFRWSPPRRRPGFRSGNGRSTNGIISLAHEHWRRDDGAADRGPDRALRLAGCVAVDRAARRAADGELGLVRARHAAEHPQVTAAELAELDASDLAKPAPMTLARMRQILGQRDVRLLTFSYFCFNYVFYLLGTWSFLYLVQQRNFTGLESGFAGMLPWIGAGIGAGIGGYLSDGMASRIGYRWGYRLVPMISLPLAGLLLLAADQRSGALRRGAGTDGDVLHDRTQRRRVLGRDDARGSRGYRRGDGRAQHGRQFCRHRVGTDHRRPVGAGHWNATFVIGAVFAFVAAACWFAIDPDRRVAARSAN